MCIKITICYIYCIFIQTDSECLLHFMPYLEHLIDPKHMRKLISFRSAFASCEIIGKVN